MIFVKNKKLETKKLICTKYVKAHTKKSAADNDIVAKFCRKTGKAFSMLDKFNYDFEWNKEEYDFKISKRDIIRLNDSAENDKSSDGSNNDFYPLDNNKIITLQDQTYKLIDFSGEWNYNNLSYDLSSFLGKNSKVVFSNHYYFFVKNKNRLTRYENAIFLKKNSILQNMDKIGSKYSKQYDLSKSKLKNSEDFILIKTNDKIEDLLIDKKIKLKQCPVDFNIYTYNKSKIILADRINVYIYFKKNGSLMDSHEIPNGIKKIVCTDEFIVILDGEGKIHRINLSYMSKSISPKPLLIKDFKDVNDITGFYDNFKRVYVNFKRVDDQRYQKWITIVEEDKLYIFDCIQKRIVIKKDFDDNVILTNFTFALGTYVVTISKFNDLTYLYVIDPTEPNKPSIMRFKELHNKKPIKNVESVKSYFSSILMKLEDEDGKKYLVKMEL